MSSKSDGTASAGDAEHRRWLIGISISVGFGLFGAIMAWLSYEARTKPVAPTIVRVPASGPEESPKARRHGGHDRN